MLADTPWTLVDTIALTPLAAAILPNRLQLLNYLTDSRTPTRPLLSGMANALSHGISETKRTQSSRGPRERARRDAWREKGGPSPQATLTMTAYQPKEGPGR